MTNYRQKYQRAFLLSQGLRRPCMLLCSLFWNRATATKPRLAYWNLRDHVEQSWVTLVKVVLDQLPASGPPGTLVNFSQDSKNCQIKPARICRSTQLICRLVSKTKCLLHVNELLWLFNTWYYYNNRQLIQRTMTFFNSLALSCYEGY